MWTSGGLWLYKHKRFFFSTIGNIHSTPINVKSQVVFSPITLWTLWKQRCWWTFSNQTMYLVMLMQWICNEVVGTLKSQYDGFTGVSDGIERQRIAFIQQWSYSSFIELAGIHIRWNYGVPKRICILHSLSIKKFITNGRSFLWKKNR